MYEEKRINRFIKRIEKIGIKTTWKEKTKKCEDIRQIYRTEKM